MGCKKISVRFDQDLYGMVRRHPLSNSDLIRESVRRFFDESNVSNDPPSFPGSDYVDSLVSQISFLQGQVTYLQRQNSYLSSGWFGRIRLLLESKK